MKGMASPAFYTAVSEIREYVQSGGQASPRSMPDSENPDNPLVQWRSWLGQMGNSSLTVMNREQMKHSIKRWSSFTLRS